MVGVRPQCGLTLATPTLIRGQVGPTFGLSVQLGVPRLTHVTARDQYRRMLNECISPELRSRGWTGGSGKYYLRGGSGHVGSLIISGNPKRSRAHICNFDVHIGVVSTYLRDFHEGTCQPSRAKPSYWSDHDWFSHVAKDLTISEDDDPMTVGRHVLALLDEVAIPPVKASLTERLSD